jgi:tRNA A-37 threonylcarbamoyl transferase component Bud32
MTTAGTDEGWEGRVLASQFRIERQLGKGGMGVVYLATQIGMDRKVVIKVMHRALSLNVTAVERFRREAQSVGRLNHPNIVQVHMFGEVEDGALYIAMEYVEGRSLAEEMQRTGAMHEARALRIVDQVLSALVEAHGVAIIHRDLKPDNIMLGDRQGNPDYVKVLDFGLAKVFGDVQKEETLTQAGMVTGTPRYMSPEQACGLKLDSRADIYSLGVMLYEMVTGVHPFEAESALDYMHKHTTEEIPPPRERVSGLQLMPRTEGLLMKALAKDPKERFQSAREMQRELRTILRDFPDASREFPTPLTAAEEPRMPPGPGVTTRVRRAQNRRLGLAVGIIGAVTLLLVAAVIFMFLEARSRQEEAAKGAAESAPVAAAADGRAEAEPTPQTAERAPAADDEVPEEPVAPATEPSDPPTAGWGTEVPDEEDEAAYEAALRKEIEAAVVKALAQEAMLAPGDEGIALVPPSVETLPVVPEADDDPDVGEPVRRPKGPTLEGLAFGDLPVMEGAELVARTEETLAYATTASGDAVLGFYRSWAQGKGCTIRGSESSLLFGDGCLLSTLAYMADESMTTQAPHMVTMVFGKERPLPAVSGVGPFGELLPEGSRISMLSAMAVMYDVKRPVSEVIAFYEERYDGKAGLNLSRTKGFGTEQLVIFSQTQATDFMTLTVTPGAKRGMAQVTATSRKAMESYGYGAGM